MSYIHTFELSNDVCVYMYMSGWSTAHCGWTAADFFCTLSASRSVFSYDAMLISMHYVMHNNLYVYIDKFTQIKIYYSLLTKTESLMDGLNDTV